MADENLDSIIEDLATRSRADISSSGKLPQKDARRWHAELFPLLAGRLSAREQRRLAKYIIQEFSLGEFPERLNLFTYEDAKLSVFAKTLPCLKSDGKSRFYVPGDLWYFNKLSEDEFLIGRFDGVGHGVEAGAIVLAAKMYIEEEIGRKVFSPREIALKLHKKIQKLRDISSTTLSLTYLGEQKARITHA